MEKINKDGAGNSIGDSETEAQVFDQLSGSPPISQEDYDNYMAMVPPAIANENWQDRLIKVKRKNKETSEIFEAIESTSQNNIYLMARFSEELRGIFILNEFSRRKMVVKCPPWEKPEKFRPRDVRDDDYPRIQMELERMGLQPSKDRAAAAIESICHDRSFHPVQKYFNNLEWDGTERLGKWLGRYLGAETDPWEYLQGVGTKWMVAAVARIFQPGCKFDHMLVLEGLTDIGKSKALRMLATFHGEEYFYDGMSFAKISDKDTMQNIQGFLILEFPELSSLQNREVEEVKQWITIQEDRGRKPYGREPVVYPRQFVLAGSTNNSEYLKDATGNKRFWPVKCGDSLDLVSLEIDRSQLWAEAVVLYRSGYRYWIPEGDEILGLAKEAQALRMVTHPWNDAVLEYLEETMSTGEKRCFVTSAEILEKAIKKPLERVKKSDEMVIANIISSNGFLKYRDGKKRGWQRKIVQQEMEINVDDDKNVV